MAQNQSSYSHGQFHLATLVGNTNIHQQTTGSHTYELHQGYPAPHQYPRDFIANDSTSHQNSGGYHNPYQTQTQNQTQIPYSHYNGCPTPFSLPNTFDPGTEYPIPPSNNNSLQSAPGQALGVTPQLPPPGLTPSNLQSFQHHTTATESATCQSNSIPPASGQPAVHTTATIQGPPAPESLRGSMAMNTKSTDSSRCRQPRNLTKATRERIRTHGLTRLRIEANSNITHSRLTDKIRDQLDELHYGFQCEVYQLAIDHGVGPHLLFEHLGWLQKKRTSISYNNYAEYDPKATKKADTVYQLWSEKDQDEKERYHDMAFIKQLVDGQIQKKKAESKGIIQSSTADQKQSRSVVSEWVRKAMIDLKSISFFHQVEGFVVLASRRPKSDFFFKQGTPLAAKFLQMFTGEDDPLGDFHTWVAGKAIEKKSEPLEAKSHVKYKKKVVPVHEWDEGHQIPNVQSIRHWLRSMMYEASKGKITEGWPATNTAEKLRQWKLDVVIEPNDKTITTAHFERPLGQLKLEPTQDILWCLGMGKIKMTYTGKKSDRSGRVTRPYKK
ncbi:hypothetical protein PCASD_09326 [Puccinia coronata f. sp. avenae]|uniref:Uncharacterized protein n=1 Tax=Puccinia coronata f. sp. avenae TaxID=200324 RepID=A0A2N5USU4_9BASI|nr:hypothetical protein PCASD_09326 [Puccinia coronata f. sp. avenae]